MDKPHPLKKYIGRLQISDNLDSKVIVVPVQRQFLILFLLPFVIYIFPPIIVDVIERLFRDSGNLANWFFFIILIYFAIIGIYQTLKVLFGKEIIRVSADILNVENRVILPIWKRDYDVTAMSNLRFKLRFAGGFHPLGASVPSNFRSLAFQYNERTVHICEGVDALEADVILDIITAKTGLRKAADVS